MSKQSMLVEGNELTDISLLEEKEWLVTNGIGSYASGTISGILTRRHHGLLVCSNSGELDERFLLFPKISENITVDDTCFPLSTDRWADGAIVPKGYKFLKEFRLEGSTPVWIYQIGDSILEKRLWMEEKENTTFVSYYLSGEESTVDLAIDVFVNFRNHHHLFAPNLDFRSEKTVYGCSFSANSQNAFKFYAQMKNSETALEQHWYKGYKLKIEENKKTNCLEDHFKAVTLRKTLAPKEVCTLVLSCRPDPELDGIKAYRQKLDREINYLEKSWTHNYDYPSWLRYLDLASQEFLVTHNNSSTLSVIAGYPYEGESTRDTLISLSGLTINNPREAKKLLLNLCCKFKNGLLPCNPNSPITEESFGNVDCSLLFFIALNDYFQRTSDLEFIRDLFIQLDEVIHYFVLGTLNGIKVDPLDGLLRAGDEKTSLTWMNRNPENKGLASKEVKRAGKAVEINALWYNALKLMADWSEKLDIKANQEYYLENARKIRRNFLRFWNINKNCLFDVIDCPDGSMDASIRANQIFAVSLPYSPILLSEQRAIVLTVEKHLLRPCGVKAEKNLENNIYTESIWPWLLGHFAIAHYKVFLDKKATIKIFDNLGKMVQDCAIGNLSELYFPGCENAKEHNKPQGCYASARSVAEILRAYKLIFEKTS
ncbi:MAG: amylo-alpha-1,6-glucosidase [Candidatus Caenarcaniphilales bacterium]|nr:amylo-alpha-1,6-glucosidase [Candidatus Caenarcaniphilales bacterium]